MAECSICTVLESKELTLFEDDRVVVLLPPEAAVPGHVIVAPKEHAEIVEKVPDDTVKHMMVIAAKLSVVLFQALQAQGTNIIWMNGPSAGQRRSHAVLHVLPRKENDNLPLAWTPKQISDDEMGTIELKLKEAAKNVGIPEEQPKPKPKVIEEPEEETTVSERVRHLERVP